MKIANSPAAAGKSAEQMPPEKNSLELKAEDCHSVYSTTRTTPAEDVSPNVPSFNEAHRLRFQLGQCTAQLSSGNQSDILRLAAHRLIHSRLAVAPQAERITRGVSDFAAAGPLLSARVLAILRKLRTKGG